MTAHEPSTTFRCIDIVDLGLTPNGESWAEGVNADGQVVGSAINEDGEEHAFTWRDGRARDLGTLGGDYSAAYAVNDHGRIVGESRVSGVGGTRAFVSSNGSIAPLATLGGLDSCARHISNAGHIVGRSHSAEGRQRAVIWTDGDVTDLGSLPDQASASFTAHGVNSAGTVVGQYKFGLAECASFLWRDGELYDMQDVVRGGDGGEPLHARAIDDTGRIAGSVMVGPSVTAVLVETGDAARARVLGTLGGSRSVCLDLSEGGLAVGMSDTASSRTHAFAAIDGVQVDLNELLPAGSPWELVLASGVNGAGLVVGHGFRNGLRRGFAMQLDIIPGRNGLNASRR